MIFMKHNYLNNTPLNKARAEYLSHLEEKGFSYKTEAVASPSSTPALTALIKSV